MRQPQLGTQNTLSIICIETEAFYRLVQEVVDHLELNTKEPDQWIDDTQAMCLLKIKSKTTLQKYRDQGYIRFSQLGKKMILYDRNSILAFIDQNAKNTF